MTSLGEFPKLPTKNFIVLVLPALMKISVMMIIMFSTAVGSILSGFILDTVRISQLGTLTPDQISLFTNAMVWFLISVATWFGGVRVDDKPFGLLSISFFIGWFFCNLGYIIGFFIFTLIKAGSLAITLDSVLSMFFTILPLTIAPTLAASVGMKES